MFKGLFNNVKFPVIHISTKAYYFGAFTLEEFNIDMQIHKFNPYNLRRIKRLISNFFTEEGKGINLFEFMKTHRVRFFPKSAFVPLFNNIKIPGIEIELFNATIFTGNLSDMARYPGYRFKDGVFTKTGDGISLRAFLKTKRIKHVQDDI